MSKILAKLVKKGTLLSIILAVIVVAASVIGIIFGFNGMNTMEDGKKVTVTVSQYLYDTESRKEEIQDACEKAFADNNILYCIDGDQGNGGEFIYAFKADENVSKAVEKLKATFADWKANNPKYETHEIIVTVTNEKVVVALAEGYVVRGIIAGVVLAVLAFAYVTIRYKWRMGAVAGISVAAAMLLTGAIVILTRIPATAAVMYAIMASALLTAITVLFNLNKLRSALKNGEKKDVEELIVSTISVKETLIFAAILGVAILLAGIPAGASAAWFALSAFIGLFVATFIGLVYAPSLCLPMQKASEAKAASLSKSGYKGAKKGEKSAQPKKEEQKEDPKQAEPVEEKTAEPAKAAEETPAEEVQEAQEEPAELSEAGLEELTADFEDVSVDEL